MLKKEDLDLDFNKKTLTQGKPSNLELLIYNYNTTCLQEAKTHLHNNIRQDKVPVFPRKDPILELR